MADLSLLPVKDSRVGDTRRRKGISGGERKRTSIGVEMVPTHLILAWDKRQRSRTSPGNPGEWLPSRCAYTRVTPETPLESLFL